MDKIEKFIEETVNDAIANDSIENDDDIEFTSADIESSIISGVSEYIVMLPENVYDLIPIPDYQSITFDPNDNDELRILVIFNDYSAYHCVGDINAFKKLLDI